MSDNRHDRQTDGSFVLDRAYFRDQARQAAKIFVAPLAGVYRAINPPAPESKSGEHRRKVK